MALNPLYVTAPSLMQYFVDKTTGEPLSGGYIYFYRDNDRTTPKPVYTLAGNQANYTYVPLSNPLILSSAGIPVDASGNPIVIYYYPFDSEGNLDLYYIVVRSSTNVPQMTVQAWPNGLNGETPETVDDVINYIPNGQLLSHTTPPNNLLVAGTNEIAQGGFTVELPDPVLSTNTIEFLIQDVNLLTPGSPRYLCQFSCTAFNTADAFKKFRIKWRDVNKFSSNATGFVQDHTFAFFAQSNVTIPFQVQIYKYFGSGAGASPPEPTTIGVGAITTEATFFNFNFNFGNNLGMNISTDTNDDFVAIEIVFPVDIAFVSTLTDFIMSNTVQTYLQFPTQTDADMLTRTLPGWVDTPDGFGADLYLPMILTKSGMTWDSSQIGKIEMMPAPVLSPNSTTPIPQNNMMPCDGATYIDSEYAANGIPFSRLGDYLRNIGPNGGGQNIPLYGTGSDYVTALVANSGAETNSFRITWNTAGAGSPQAVDGGTPTGFTFTPVYIYNGSTTGTAAFPYTASNNGIDNVITLFGNEYTNINPFDPVFTTFQNGSTSPGFTFTHVAGGGVNALTAFNRDFARITTISSAGFPATGAAAFFQINTTGGTNYNFWYNAGTATSPGGAFPVQINIPNTYTDSDVADLTIGALNALQSTNIEIDAAPPEGSYFIFNSNPSALRTFVVWYTYVDSSVPPAVTGEKIKVKLSGTPTPNQVRDLTRFAINGYQYASPNFDGVFFRNADPNSVYDTDSDNRWSNVPNVGGNMAGTFEYDQFRNHYHTYLSLQQIAPSNQMEGGSPYYPGNANTTNSGGSETRPVNTYIYPIIRY